MKKEVYSSGDIKLDNTKTNVERDRTFAYTSPQNTAEGDRNRKKRNKNNKSERREQTLQMTENERQKGRR